MAVPDAKTRNTISLNPSKVLSSSIPSRFLPKILFSNACFVFALLVAKEWLLDFDIGVFWVMMRVLACGGLGVLVWEARAGQLLRKEGQHVEWLVLAMASLFLFIQQACLFTAVYRLSSMRAIIFVQFSSAWIGTILNTTQSNSRKSLIVLFAMALSLVSDAGFSIHNLGSAAPGYVAIIVHGLSSVVLDHSYGVLSPALGVNAAVAASTLGASAFALPFYLFRSFMLGFPSEPVLPLLSLASIPFISYSLLFLSPIALRSLKEVSPTSRHVVISYPMSVCLAAGFGPLAFSHMPSWTDIVVATVLYSGMYPTGQEAYVASPRTPTSRLLRGYLKTILSNPESRRIFYFLMLNMAYMLVQMLYGVWTNSLGLISDAIHMAFDCMAIGVGLFASVMATWDPNERFTYGYGRIETLSGFANGIFLILISIFIVFEAIQRILDPPEMDTSQLLLVSSLGLAVNLFGMFAMGGHHHHVREDTHILMVIHMDIPRTKGRSLMITPIHIPQLPHTYLSHLLTRTHIRNLTLTLTLTLIPRITPIHHPDSHSPLHDHEDHTPSPVTPSYVFGHDDHFDVHHQNGHKPNVHDHSHHHSHEGHSHNMRGVFLHVMADTLGSVGVIISTLLIQFYGWTGFDPIASLFIAILIVASVIPLVLDTGKVLALDIGDRTSNVNHTLGEVEAIEGVVAYSDPHFWPKDAEKLIGSIKVQIASPALLQQRGTNLNLDHVVEQVDTLLRKRIHGLEELTIQVEEAQ
ncbi:putative zinc transporter msc2 [Marasmius sp. AFHP31]|nr:putative zinc transporter msc2 [Marasmius sp. AFHP31]